LHFNEFVNKFLTSDKLTFWVSKNTYTFFTTQNNNVDVLQP